MRCQYCKYPCHKKGFSKNGTQKYYCTSCGNHQQDTYAYPACKAGTDSWIIRLVCNGCGIRGISRALGISATTVVAKIKVIAAKINKPRLSEQWQCYEMDKLRTFVGNKRNECWVTYAINRVTKQPIDFRTGARTQANIGKVVSTLLNLSPKRIYTDRLNAYLALITLDLHHTGKRQTNHIERMNLTLRTQLKRLSRRTICFSKSIEVLDACLKICFWCPILLKSPHRITCS